MEFIGLLLKPKCNLDALSIREDSTAIITPHSLLTYKQLNEKISSTVQSLLKLGIKRWNKAAILSENSTEYVILILALWKIGAVPVPLNIRLLPNELEELILFAGCNFLFTGKLNEEIKSFPGINIFRFPLVEEMADKYLLDENKSSYSIRKFKMNNPALIIFTSGSIGKPKGVVLSFNNLFYSALYGNKLFKHQRNDRWLASLPFYHIGGFSIITRNFLYGTTLIIPRSLTINDIVYAIEILKPSLASLVTTQLQRLMKSKCTPNPELRLILLGGGFIETALVSEALKKGWNVSKSYGTTETASFVAALSAEEFGIKPLSAGKAIPPNQILILDADKNTLPNERVGEIAVKADSVSMAYFNNKVESKNKFSGNIFYSGDYGYLDKDGFLFVESRREDLIISGGENIVPSEVEAEILKYPGVKEVCAFGLNDREWGQIVAAAIVSEDSITVDELKKFLKERLPSFKHPRKILILDELPKTELGKIQKGKIKEKFNN
jgi:O-succinylbenzoic acid--CoA ligase